MAYQYPTYQQALPDTTLYERLQGSYTPIQGRPNPYQGMLSQDALDYQADPFGYVKKKFGSLDKVLKKDAPDVGLGGLFSSQPSTGGDSGGDTGGRNYYQEIEDRFYQENLTKGLTPETAKTLAAQQAFEIQSANNARINAGLTLFGNAMIPGMGALGVAKYGPTGYMDYLQGNTRVMMGDTSGYQSPFTPKAAGIAAPVVSGQSNYNTISASQQIANDILAREAENRAMSEISRNYGGFRDNGTYVTSYGPVVSTSGMSPETTAGLEAAQASFGYGTNADYYGD
jgi:hypothetical protein